MKRNILWLGLIIAGSAMAQSFSEELSREFAFEKKSLSNALILANINGNVDVVGYEGDKILLEVTRRIDAKTDERLRKGKDEVSFGVIDRADTLIIYVKDGCNEFGKNRSRQNHSGWSETGWGYQSANQHDCNLLYDYRMDFTLKVPNTVNLLVSTINDGDVQVEAVSGGVRARNINGSIRLKNLRNEAEATTINGDVDVEYALNPSKECRFYTLNGDINAMFQSGLSANLSFESFNGSFYTNVTGIENLPAQVTRSDRRDGVRYKISGNQYKIRNGGALLDFETFNGDVYLKEITN
jgi:DUF4097 and DUF4098 domain-containing protein YvlB